MIIAGKEITLQKILKWQVVQKYVRLHWWLNRTCVCNLSCALYIHSFWPLCTIFMDVLA